MEHCYNHYLIYKNVQINKLKISYFEIKLARVKKIKVSFRYYLVHSFSDKENSCIISFC